MSYNPFQAAATVLTDSRAIQFYADTATDHTFKVYAAIRSIALTVYGLGVDLRTWLDAVEASSYPVQPILAPAPSPIGLLPAVSTAPTPPVTPVAPLDGLGVRELRRIASERGIKGASRMSKAAALAALTA